VADIRVKCLNCGNEVAVSEYADRAGLKCPGCQHPLKLPGRVTEPTAPPAPGTQLRPGAAGGKYQLRASAAQQTTVTPAFSPSGFDPTQEIQTRAQSKSRAWSSLWAWGLFLVLTGVLCYLRYIPEMSGDRLAPYRAYGLIHSLPDGAMLLYRKFGLICIGIIYVAGILMAWKDEMFQGILCTVIPLYPFYYILFVTDLFFLRAILMALILGFAKDLTFFVGGLLSNIINSVDAWIMQKTPEPKAALFK